MSVSHWPIAVLIDARQGLISNPAIRFVLWLQMQSHCGTGGRVVVADPGESSDQEPAAHCPLVAIDLAPDRSFPLGRRVVFL